MQSGEKTVGSPLDYYYFKEISRSIAIDLSKHQGLDGDPKAMQQIHFTRNRERTENATLYCILFVKK